METTADRAAEIASRMVTDIGATSPGRRWLTGADVRSYIGAWHLDLEPSDTLINRVLAILRDRCRSWGPGVVGTPADGAARPFTIFVIIEQAA